MTKTQGMSIVEVIVAIGLLGLLSAGLMKFFGMASKSAQSSSRLVDRQSLQANFLQNLNCQKTLGLATPTSVIPCSGTFAATRADGTPFPNPLGQWKHRTSCVGNALLVEVENVKPDPLIGPVPWQDLYKGTSAFCRNNFAGSPCTPPDMVIGMAGPVPVCGGWPSGSYCIVQSQTAGCPAGFAAVDPSGTPGGQANGESFLVRGGPNSSTPNMNIPWAMVSNVTTPVQLWAWCCK